MESLSVQCHSDFCVDWTKLLCSASTGEIPTCWGMLVMLLLIVILTLLLAVWQGTAGVQWPTDIVTSSDAELGPEFWIISVSYSTPLLLVAITGCIMMVQLR